MEFQKTYNSLGRDTWKGKVEKNDIDGKFLDIIYVMYKASNVSLLYKNNNKQVTEPFYTTFAVTRWNVQ